MRCKAKSKQTGNQCKNHAVPGKDVCRFHGGKTPTKHGLYSKYTKIRLGELIEKNLNNPQLLEIRNQIALVISLIQKLLETNSKGKDGINQEFVNQISILAMRASVLIERLNKIENGELTRVKIEDLDAFVKLIVNIINRNIQNVDTRNRIAKDIRESFGANFSRN